MATGHRDDGDDPLKKLAVPHVRVRREGQVREISARDLVVGDVMLLEAGNVVAADGRLIDAATLRTQEAALTGESQLLPASSLRSWKIEKWLKRRRPSVIFAPAGTTPA